MKQRPPDGIGLATLKRLKAYADYFASSFRRKEQRYWSQKYLAGLIMEGERKSIEPMAQRVPGGDVQAMQQFIGQSPWEWEALQIKCRERLLSRMGKGGCVLVVDDTGFLKKGKHSVGVQRQYYGLTGTTENCQSAVSCYCAKGGIGFSTGMRLYLPEIWCADEERRRKTGIPADVQFEPKWGIALKLVDEALASGMETEAVVADAGYGNIAEFRDGLEARDLSFIVGVHADMALWKAGIIRKKVPRTKGRGRPRTAYLMEEKPQGAQDFVDEKKWKTVRWRKGSKGWLSASFQSIRVDWVAKQYRRKGLLYGEPKQYWLLIKRTETGELKYFISNLPERTSLRKLVELSHARWTIELSYQQMKEELGLDHFEGRGWLGWHHHVTMVMLAYGFLMEERLRRKKKSDCQPSLQFVGF